MEPTADDAEAVRLATLEGYAILDTPGEPEFQAIVQIARVTLHAPIVLVSLVDRDRQWCKARTGGHLAQMPRDGSFCAHAIGCADMLMIPDTHRDERFARNPLVTGPPHIRFYAGAPLKAGNGTRVGTLCAMDTAPRPRLPDRQRIAMERLAVETVDAMERRLARLNAAA